MEIEKAIEVLSKHKKSYEQSIQAINTVDEINKDWNGTAALGQPISEETHKRNKDNLEACTLAIQALEKQVGKKPQEIDIDFSTFVCPNCSSTILYMDEKETHNHCLKCGQKFDWGD